MLDWLENLFKKVNTETVKVNTQSKTRKTIIKILNCFEQGSPEFRHDKVDYLKDGVFPGSSERQVQITISYGLVQTGILPVFLKEYSDLGAKFSNDFKPYLPKLKLQSLTKDAKFEALLKRAAREDKVYTDLLESYFDKYYLGRADEWAKENGFKESLSILIIADSFLHSGSILPFLRKRFPEKTPINGGSERRWIEQYIAVRRDWLKNHSDPILRKIWTRPQFYLDQITKGNWDLKIFPIKPNGIIIND